VPVLGAKKPATDRFQDFHSKSLLSTPLKLTDSSYARLTKAPRDYSVAVLLTALETKYGCKLCREFEPEWELLAKSWIKGDKKGESRLIYGTLDFGNGKETFQSVRSRAIAANILANSNSLVFKALRYCYSSGQQQGLMLWQTAHLFVMISPAGKMPF